MLDPAVRELHAQLARLEAERTALRAGTHELYLQKVAILESRKTDDLAKAAINRRLAEDAARAQFEFAQHAAERICEDGKRRLADLMVAELEDRQKAIMERLTGGPDTAAKGEWRGCVGLRLLIDVLL